MRAFSLRTARALVALSLLSTTLISCGTPRATAQQTASPTTAAATSVPTAAAKPTVAATSSSGSVPLAATTTSAPAAAAPAASGQVIAGQPAAGDPPLTQGIVAQVGKRSTPGIVQITNEQQVLQQSGSQLVPAGTGTGFVIDNRGHIITNNHVIAQAQRLVVQTTDGRTFPGKLIGRDPRTDLAVVQVEGQNLPVLPLGDSSRLQVGQWVVAIGNALGLEGGPTLTVGVVSALGRVAQEPGDQPNTPGPYLFDLVQTDAAINPGNSGGPLLNLAGEVIGVNTLGSAQAQGISFAIAINTAKRIADELIRNGKVDYAFMGVSVTPNSPALAQRFGLAAVPGLAVAEVGQNTPAARAGIQAKDVITSIDGKELKAESDLSRLLSEKKPGDTVAVGIARPGGAKQEVRVTLGTAPAVG